jgi:hypothetical protein
MSNTLTGEVGYAYSTSGTIYLISCGKCGIVFGVPNDFDDRRRVDGEGFYCPNGHCRVYNAGKTKAEKDLAEAERKLQRKQDDLDWYSRQLTVRTNDLAATTRSRAAIKGQLTKAKNRIAKGVCPCCNRQFPNVRDHMATKHPDYAVPE